MNDPKALEGPSALKRSYFQLQPGVFVGEGSKYRSGTTTWSWENGAWVGPRPLPPELEFRQYRPESIRPVRGMQLPGS